MPTNKHNIIDRIDEIVTRIQTIQKKLRGSSQPASSTEITELKRLGTEYGELVKKLERSSD